MNLTLGQLSPLFGVSAATLSRALTVMTLYLRRFVYAYKSSPCAPDFVERTTPLHWRFAYAQIPYEISDVTEVPMEIPDDPFLKKLFYSHYTKRYVYKHFAGVHPNGLAAFCSEGFVGSIFDTEICDAGRII